MTRFKTLTFLWITRFKTLTFVDDKVQNTDIKYLDDEVWNADNCLKDELWDTYYYTDNKVWSSN